MKESKIVLGTAQLGSNYGIANKEGKPTKKDAFRIMKYAIEKGIFYFDTAYCYGNSEIIIGKFLNFYNDCNNKINIITKMASLSNEIINEKIIRKYFFNSLHRLKQESIYCYMVHNFNDVKNNCDLINDSFLKLREEGYIKKIGVSVYDKHQIDYLLKNFNFDLIQLPVSVFDQRLLENNVLSELKKRKKDIYARSIFLQGLIFLNKDSLPLKFKSIRKYLEKINNISLKFDISKEEIALLFINSISEINKIVIGLGKIEHLKKDIKAVNRLEKLTKIERFINFQDLFIKDIKIIDPRKW